MLAGWRRFTFTGELAPIVNPDTTFARLGGAKLFSMSAAAESRKGWSVGEAEEGANMLERMVGIWERAVGEAVGFRAAREERSEEAA